MIEKTEFDRYQNCLRLSNGTVDLVVSTDFGPRILFYGFAGGENILGLHPDARVETPLGEWRPYGGHRLWMAPENMPLSYAPDNNPVETEEEGATSMRFRAPTEEAAKIQKEMHLRLSETGSEVVIDHRIANRGDSPVELAAWALTIMRGGGAAVVPHEPFAPYGPETLLPVRTLTVWSYTDFTDPRWQFGKNLIRLKTDGNLGQPQKFGALNRRGWAAYEWKNLLFVKRFDCAPNAVYPDMNSNTEIYTAGSFVEVESLSPLVRLDAHDSIVHTERWELHENAKAESLLED